MPDYEMRIVVKDDGTAVVDKFTNNLENSTKKLNKSTKDLGKTQTKTTKSTKGFGAELVNLKTVAKAAGVVLGVSLVKSLVEATDLIDRSTLRLSGMVGGMEEAEKMMRFFRATAQTVPFDLSRVIQAGVQLEAFGADARETTKAVANLAAFMGEDIVFAANSFGRAFAGGAGAADILRERGVLTLVKLKAGVDDLKNMTLPEFRTALMETMVDPMGPIAGAADKLATTFTGKMSMMRDAVFQLKVEMSEKWAINPTMKMALDVITAALKAHAQEMHQVNTLNKAMAAGEAQVAKEIDARFVEQKKRDYLNKRGLLTDKQRLAVASDIRRMLHDEGMATIDMAEGWRDVAWAFRDATFAEKWFEKTRATMMQNILSQPAMKEVFKFISPEEIVSKKIDILVTMNGQDLSVVQNVFDRMVEGPVAFAERLTSWGPAISQFMKDSYARAVEHQAGLEEILEGVSNRFRSKVLSDAGTMFNTEKEQTEYARQQAANYIRWKQAQISATVDFFGAMQTLSSTFFKKAWALQKAFALASAITSGASAITKALNAGVGPPWSFALAAVTAAKVAAQIAVISAQSPAGMGGGGGAAALPTESGGSTAPAGIGESATNVTNMPSINISVSGFVGDEATLASALADVVKEAVGDGADFGMESTKSGF